MVLSAPIRVATTLIGLFCSPAWPRPPPDPGLRANRIPADRLVNGGATWPTSWVTVRGEHGRHLVEGALEALRWHWDGAYDFVWGGARCVARRADTGVLVTAPTPEGSMARSGANTVPGPSPGT